jgi:VanZ family protein
MIKRNIFSLIIALIILYLSLASSDTLNKVTFFNISYFDKIAHFGMYFTLMSVILIENRKLLKKSVQIFYVSLIPLCYGIFMEVLQLVLTSSRSASFYDVVFNAAGILFSLLVWLLIRPFSKHSVR